MENSIIFMILFQLVLILLNAVFACAEIAVISMNENRLMMLSEEGDKRAVRLVKLTNQPARFLATIQVAITLSGFLGSAFAADNFSGVMVDALVEAGVSIPVNILDSASVVLITIILSYVTLVFGELVPKQIAMRKSEQLALGLSGLLTVVSKIFAPLVSLLTISTNGVLGLFGIDPNMEEDEVSEEEIRMMVDAGSKKGTIDCEERDFIQNVFEFDDISADEILTHRTEVQMLDMEDSMEEWERTIADGRHTLYPVCDGTADRIVGVLDAKEYFRLADKSREQIMEKAVRAPYFVPDTVKADTLFRNMKREHHALAIVMDEYGGMSGIITINDLIEQLVGELEDEPENDETASIIKIGENKWQISGSATLDEVSETLGIALESDDFDTFSGFVIHEIGSIPQEGLKIKIDVLNLHIYNVVIENYQVATAVVSIRQTDTEEKLA